MRKLITYFQVSSIALLMLHCGFTATQKEKPSEYPVLETMGYYQRFTHKLYLAGTNGNWPLAAFYNHELEEVSEELINANVIHDDFNLSNLSESLLLPTIDYLEQAIEAKDQVLFMENYTAMISSCNLCHKTTGHSFIQITVPNDSTIWNQQF